MGTRERGEWIASSKRWRQGDGSNPMKNLELGVLCALLGLWSAGAAEVAKGPTVREILDRYVAGSGGRAALEKIQTRVMKGNIEVTALGATGQFTVRNKAPNRQTTLFEFGGFGSVREGFDGTVAWSAVPLQGVTRKKGSELARAKRSTVFPRELRLEEVYERLEFKGSAPVGTNTAWVLEGVVKEGPPDRLYFDQKSGLLLREETKVESVAGELAFQIDFEDYRLVDGVKVPFLMKVPQPAQIGFRVQFEEVKHNVELADSVFGEPKD